MLLKSLMRLRPPPDGRGTDDHPGVQAQVGHVLVVPDLLSVERVRCACVPNAQPDHQPRLHQSLEPVEYNPGLRVRRRFLESAYMPVFSPCHILLSATAETSCHVRCKSELFPLGLPLCAVVLLCSRSHYLIFVDRLPAGQATKWVDG